MSDPIAPPPEITADSDVRREGSQAKTSLPVLQQFLERDARPYCCPGEREPISRAVHLSRRARFYPACRRCEHANAEPIAVSGASGGVAPPAREAATPLVTPGGIRGVYLNQIGRSEAERLALAVAHELWQAGRRGRDADELTATEAAPLHRPEVAVGRDARSSSPDIACGIVRGLRRMGCRVVDLGVISRPTLDFAVYHLRCTAGIQVTGAGSPAAVTGIDLIDAEGVPWSSPGRFDRLAEWRTGVPARPTRVAGALRNFDVAAPESVDFRRFLSGVRHMRVGLAVDDLILRRQQERWFADSGCEFVAAPFALGAFESEELPPPVRRELRVWSKSERLQFTARIAEDGRCIRLYDEQARVIAPNDWLLRIAEQTLSGTTGARLVAGSSVSGLVRGRLKAHGIELIATQGGDEQLVTALVGCETGLAADGRGRVWFADHYPLCHGFVTLTHVMRLAAESRQPVSHWAA